MMKKYLRRFPYVLTASVLAFLMLFLLNLALSPAQDALAGWHYDDLGPYGEKYGFWGCVSLPGEAECVSGALVTIQYDSQVVAGCTYTGTGAGSGCANVGSGHHAETFPYYGMGICGLLKAAGQDCSLHTPAAFLFSVQYTKNGHVYQAQESLVVDASSFNYGAERRVDITLFDVTPASDGGAPNEVNWPASDRLNVQLMEDSLRLMDFIRMAKNAGPIWPLGVSLDDPALPPTVEPIDPETRYATYMPPPLPKAPGPNTLCVDPAATSDLFGCGCTPATYCKSIQKALQIATEGMEIRLKGTEYNRSNQEIFGSNGMIDITKGITITGGWNDDFTERDLSLYKTILNAEHQGQVIYISGDITPTLDGLTIVGGYAYQGSGIYALNAHLILTTLVISGNQSTGGSGTLYGGAGIFLDNADRTVISNTLVVNNSLARNGGGIFLYQADQVLIQNTDVLNNRANGSGGGIFVYSSAISLTLQSVAVVSNTASTSSAGGIDLTGKGAVLKDVLLRGNTGEGLHMVSDNARLENVTTMGNSTRQYAGGYIDGDNLQLSHIVVLSNTAQISYSGFYLLGNNITLTDAAIMGNRANSNNGDVGGLYLQGTNARLTNLYIYNNVAGDDVGGLSLSGNSATLKNIFLIDNLADGKDNDVNPTGCNMITSSPVTLTNVLVQGNQGKGSSGYANIGGLFISGNDAKLERLVIKNNRSTGNTGGLYLVGNRATARNLKLLNNIGGGGNGGGAYLSGYGMNFDGFVIQGNQIPATSSHNGGGIYLTGSNQSYPSTFKHGIVVENLAYNGGGLYLPGYVRLENLVVADNQIAAAGKGSGIYIAGSDVKLMHQTIVDNRGGGGQGVYVASGTTMMTNTLVVSQSLALQVASGTLYIWNTVFYSNTDIDLPPPNNIISDPKTVRDCKHPIFEDQQLGDYHLTYDSGPITCAIDQGISLPGILKDTEGGPRPSGAAPDVGADEYAFGGESNGSAVSTVVLPLGLARWDTCVLTATIPLSTSIHASILDRDGNILNGLAGRTLQNGRTEIDLSAVDANRYPGLRIRIDLSSHAPGASPQLNGWGMAWKVAASVTHAAYGHATDGHGNVLSDTLVILLRNGLPIAETTTGRQGQYSFRGITAQAGENYQVRVSLKTGAGLPMQVRYAKDSTFAGPVVYLETPPFNFDSDSMFTTQVANFDFAKDAERYASSVPESQRLDDLTAIYRHTQQALDFIQHTLGATMPLLDVNAYASSGVSEAYYDRENQAVVIAAAYSGYNNGNRPMNREWHETFHALMDHTIGIYDDSCEPDINHGGYNNCSTSDSWAEGWAEFWTVALAQELGWQDPYLYEIGDKNGLKISMDVNWQAWDYHCPGAHCKPREEFAVASLLWDLLDKRQDGEHKGGEQGQQDTISLSLSQLWDILSSPEPALYNMKDVHEKLVSKDVGRGNTHSDLCGLSDLDEVFVMHGFFADVDDDQDYDCDETVGLTGDSGRPDRRDVPLTGASATFTLQSQEPLTMPVTMWVNMFFPDEPDLSYHYSVEVTDFPTVTLFLEPPPARMPVTVTVWAQGEAVQMGTIEPFTISNIEYWEKIEQGEPVTGTIEMGHQLFLPSIIKR